MPKNIKISQRQLKMLESSDDSFLYISNSNITPYDGQKNISSDGKTNGITNGSPVTGDKVAQSMTPQSYNRYSSYGNIYPSNMMEGVDVSNDKDNDGIDDFYNNDELNILNNDTANDDLTKVPDSIISKIDNMISLIKQSSLTNKQQAILLSKIITSFNISNIPYSWKKELILKIRNS